MSDIWITLAVAIPTALLWSSLVDLGMALLGPKPLREFYKRNRAEKMLVMRSLPRWKVVLIEGVVYFGLLMVAVFTLVDYVRSRYEPSYHFHADAIPAYFVIFISCGIWAGFSAWNRIWDPKFDLPKASHS
jgi:hypothetical protein